MPTEKTFKAVEPPDIINEIVNGFQYETTVDVPGVEGRSYQVTLGVLWNDEIRDIQRDIGRRVSPNDFISRELETQFETVVRAIVSIGTSGLDTPWQITVPDEEDTRARKGKLRQMLGKLPRTVAYLYDKYNELVHQRDTAYDAALELIKKSSRTPIPPDEAEVTSHIDSESGAVIGN